MVKGEFHSEQYRFKFYFNIKPEKLSKKDWKQIAGNRLRVQVEIDSNINIIQTTIRVENISSDGKIKLIKMLETIIEKNMLPSFKELANSECKLLKEQFNKRRRISLQIEIPY